MLHNWRRDYDNHLSFNQMNNNVVTIIFVIIPVCRLIIFLKDNAIQRLYILYTSVCIF